MYGRPPFLRGLYLCLDYNHNPVARRILFVKRSDSVARDEFLNLRGGLKPSGAPDDREKRYCGYTCGKEDIVRMCNIPSPADDGGGPDGGKEDTRPLPPPCPCREKWLGKAGKAAALRRKSAAAFFRKCCRFLRIHGSVFREARLLPQGRASGIRRTSSAVGRVLRMVPSLSERICPPAVPVRRTPMLSSKGGACQK